MSSRGHSMSRQRRGGQRRGDGNKPPQLKTNIIVNHTYRFTSTSGTSTAITPESLMGAAGGVCYLANADFRPVFDSVKVNSVKMWAPPPSQGSASTCSVEWVGSISSQVSNLEISDTSNSTATPAIVRSVPPRQSLASFWQQGSTNTLFTLTAPVGTIIDVSLSLILADDPGVANTISITTGTLGQIYYLSLDPNATNRYVPVSLNTTS